MGSEVEGEKTIGAREETASRCKGVTRGHLAPRRPGGDMPGWLGMRARAIRPSQQGAPRAKRPCTRANGHRKKKKTSPLYLSAPHPLSAHPPLSTAF